MSDSSSKSAMGRERPIGAVRGLFRYPVKSMLGEARPEILMTPHGVLGDRRWALRDPVTGRIAAAKKHPRLLECRATYELEPTLERDGRVRIDLPDGSVTHPDDQDASRIVSEVIGARVIFERHAGGDEKATIDRSTVFGDVPAERFKPEWTAQTIPDYFQLKSGTFFEIGAVFILATGSLGYLGQLVGEHEAVDLRRFRPNVCVESAPAPEFAEDAWIGGRLRLGPVTLCDDLQPTVWCVTATLPQQGLPRDLRILRCLAERHQGCLGVYAAVKQAGIVRDGDIVTLLEP